MNTPDDYASFDEVKISEAISKHVFNREFNHLKERLDKQESLSFNIIVGAVIATFLVIIGLAYSTWLFMAQYNESLIETQNVFRSEMQDMRKENFEYKESLREDGQSKQKTIPKNS